jgi:hypothetical protein
VRLDSPRGWATGRDVNVTVDVPRMYFFDTDGQRIDSSPMRRPSAAQYR